MAKHNELGQKGELLAQQLLEDKGYQVIATNWRHSRAEIDIIAKQPALLVFVEVKTRSNLSLGQPEEFVTPKKERLMASAAFAFMEQTDYNGEIRFDIISVHLPNHGLTQLKHIEDAFFPGLD
ncbi:MAG: YraN family protein [Saprospiraceae bacterium]